MALKAIYERQKTAFALNIEFGYILVNNEVLMEEDESQTSPSDELLRYYYGSQNTKFFAKARVIRNKKDLKNLIRDLDEESIAEWAASSRPNSKWQLERVANFTVKLMKMGEHPLGSLSEPLPSYIKNNKTILALDVNRNNGKLFRDNLCLFRCLALFFGGKITGLERMACNFARRWVFARGLSSDLTQFEGVFPGEIDDFEEFFKVGIAFWHLEQKIDYAQFEVDEGDLNEQIVAREELQVKNTHGSNYKGALLRRPKCFQKNVMHVNLYQNHCSYITNVKSFCQSWECSKCHRLFNHYSHFEAHSEVCREGASTKFVYPGGAFCLKRTAKEELELLGFDVSRHNWFYPYFAVFDCESFFDKSKAKGVGSKSYEHGYLDLASISVASNVPGFENPFFLCSDGDPDALVRKFLERLYEIQFEASRAMRVAFRRLIKQVEEKRSKNSKLKKSSQGKWEASVNYGNQLKRVTKMLDMWLDELVVFSFNGGKFDMNLLRKWLFANVSHAKPQIIKRGRSYMCVSFSNIKFQDISNHLAANVSYEKWLKAYNIKQSKFYFPHDWFVSLHQLDQTELPPISSYYNSLKEEDMPEENYEKVVAAWNGCGMRTMRDMLEFYNNADVGPFVHAVMAMQQWWKTQNIDMFRDGISLPGPFNTFNNNDDDTYVNVL